MSKIKKELLSNACYNLTQDSSSKFWGLICVLSAIETTEKIKAGVTYKIDTIKLSQTLERLFYFGDIVKSFSDSGNYVTFSTQWSSKAREIFAKNDVSIDDAALFFNLSNEITENSDIKSVVDGFVSELKLSDRDAREIFDMEYTNESNIVEDDDYTKQAIWVDIKSKLGIETDNTTLTMESPYTVVSHPAELSRAPFIQTLYAAQSNFECLLLTKFNFNELYTKDKNLESKGQRISTVFTEQKIFFGAPGTGKSHEIENVILKDVNKEFVFRTTFHPDTDYASFVGCYKPISYCRELIRTDYTIDELAEMLKTRYASAAIRTTALHSFALEYADYFNGVIASFNKKDLVLKAGLVEDYKIEINKITNLNQWMVENNYLSTTSSTSYEFSPEVFTNAYVKAYNNPTEHIYLVIEEINRGNCAQIFGDLFQLLDRRDGVSEYAIKADTALSKYLHKKLTGGGLEGIKGDKLRLPANLSILATMNTSDQSLFPMDSAFKRRWDWKYISIDTQHKKIKDTKINIGDNQYSWGNFLDEVNKRIYDVNNSEDKQLGQFFATKGDDIDFDQFRSKVMFYLWFEIYKDEERDSIFKTTIGADEESSLKSFTFGDLFKKNGEALLQDFMEQLQVPFTPISSSHTTSEEVEDFSVDTAPEYKQE